MIEFLRFGLLAKRRPPTVDIGSCTRMLRRRTRISACNAARDRNSPATKHQTNLPRSIIALNITRFVGNGQMLLGLR